MQNSKHHLLRLSSMISSKGCHITLSAAAADHERITHLSLSLGQLPVAPVPLNQTQTTATTSSRMTHAARPEHATAAPIHPPLSDSVPAVVTSGADQDAAGARHGPPPSDSVGSGQTARRRRRKAMSDRDADSESSDERERAQTRWLHRPSGGGAAAGAAGGLAGAAG